MGYNPWGRKELDTTERLLCVCVCVCVCVLTRLQMWAVSKERYPLGKSTLLGAFSRERIS